MVFETEDSKNLYIQTDGHERRGGGSEHWRSGRMKGKIWENCNSIINKKNLKNERGEITTDTTEIQRTVRNYSQNELTTTQNLWDTAKAVLRGQSIAMKSYFKKIETFQTNNLTLRLQELQEQQQRQPRARRRKEMTTIREELNDIETKAQF